MGYANATVQLDVVSPEAQIFAGSVRMVVVTGELGELGLLPGHAPLLTTIKPGQIRITLPDQTQAVYYVSGGILEVQPYVITILADTVIRAEDLDEVAALNARDHAKKVLTGHLSELEFTKALAQLAQATAQLRTIKLVRRDS